MPGRVADASELSNHWPSLLAIILAGLSWFWYNHARSRKSPLPPGPSAAWYSPGPRAPETFARLVETHGPVFSYKQGRNVVVVIGRHQAALEIMQRHSSALSDRPQNIAAGEIYSGGMRTLLTPAGEQLRKLRKALHSQLQANVSLQYVPVQYKHAKGLLMAILNEPEKHVEHATRYAASVIMSITYGKTSPTYYSDPEVQEVVRGAARLGALLGGSKRHVVDVYPILRYIPLFTSTLRHWRADEHELFTSQVAKVRKQVEAGSAQPSFVTYLLDRQEEFGLSDDELAYLAGSMFGAGAETSASAISFIIMAAAVHPEEQAKVQEQLDAVVGYDRVPSPEDESSLSQVIAFYLESYRWRPVSWGGFAHRATQDIFWNDYVIPAGAAVVGCHWAIAHDPDVYTEPQVFKPDRWLSEDGSVREDLTFPNFGFGRRVCVGQNVANNSLFLTTALLLWAFKITEDPSSPIDSMAFSDTANTRPGPFRVKFVPRIENLRNVVETSLLL